MQKEYKININNKEIIILQDINGKFIKPKELLDIESFGTALKPACEPIVVARKPLSEKNVALNVLKWGTGGINIDDCRVGFRDEEDEYESKNKNQHSKYPKSIMKNPANNGIYHEDKREPTDYVATGRFPANIILDEKAGKILDEQSGELGNNFRKSKANGSTSIFGSGKYQATTSVSDKGGASRFFYCAKSSKAERNKGTDSFINVEVLKGICEENNLTKEERLAKLSVDMEVFQRKGIEEYGIQNKKDYEWNTILFGRNIMEKYRKDIQSIIKTKINSTIQLKILNWLKHLLIREYTLDVKSSMENGGNLAENVEKSKELTIIINEKLELALGVKGVVSGMQLKIKLSEGKCDHPTVKPIKLMQYLVKLVTKKGGIVLDPFGGSGTTGIACIKEEMNYILIEKDKDYCKIAKARIKVVEDSHKN